MILIVYPSTKTKNVADILAKTIVAEVAIVKKAGGKYKMLPLFDETSAKIKDVC